MGRRDNRDNLLTRSRSSSTYGLRKREEVESREKNIQIFIGGLSRDADKDVILDIFTNFGKVLNVWIAQRPPGFGFVLMSSHMDAGDAVRSLNGTTMCGKRVMVAFGYNRSYRLRSSMNGDKTQERDDGSRNSMGRNYSRGTLRSRSSSSWNNRQTPSPSSNSENILIQGKPDTKREEVKSKDKAETLLALQDTIFRLSKSSIKVKSIKDKIFERSKLKSSIKNKKRNVIQFKLGTKRRIVMCPENPKNSSVCK